MDREQLRPALEAFYSGMLQYRKLLLERQYSAGEAFRSKLNIAYGELRDEIQDLKVPMHLQMSGRTFPIFETALQRFDPSFEFPIGRNIDAAIQTLETAIGIINRARPRSKDKVPARRKNTVFLVHGHDGKTREMVARLLERIGAEPIILSEKPGRSRTLIEKLEQEGLGAEYAVVLLTGDDVGGENVSEPSLKLRARQNVILELGYFIGKLGREHVVVLYQEKVELPSDYGGVEYILLQGDWKLRLGNELQAAGIAVDLNKAR